MIAGMRTRVALSLAALVLTVGACSDDDGGEITSGGARDEPESSAPSTTETPAPATPEAGPADVCDLADASDVEAAYGEPVPPGSPGSGNHSENDLEWQSDNCNWEVEDGLDVRLGVSVAEDFPDGELLCPELPSFDAPSTQVRTLGEGASWVNDEFDPNEGTLRICADAEMVDIDVESPDGSRDPDTLREQTVALAEVVVANLG
jgi:hypothetical protein